MICCQRRLSHWQFSGELGTICNISHRYYTEENENICTNGVVLCCAMHRSVSSCFTSSARILCFMDPADPCAFKQAVGIIYLTVFQSISVHDSLKTWNVNGTRIYAPSTAMRTEYLYVLMRLSHSHQFFSVVQPRPSIWGAYKRSE